MSLESPRHSSLKVPPSIAPGRPSPRPRSLRSRTWLASENGWTRSTPRPKPKREQPKQFAAIEARQRGDCQPVGEVTSATLKMVDISDGPARQYAVGLDVLINGKRKRLEIDTGSSGVTISRGSAISAGLIPEAEIKTGGFGDRGPANTCVTHVDDLRTASSTCSRSAAS